MVFHHRRCTLAVFGRAAVWSSVSGHSPMSTVAHPAHSHTGGAIGSQFDCNAPKSLSAKIYTNIEADGMFKIVEGDYRTFDKLPFVTDCIRCIASRFIADL